MNRADVVAARDEAKRFIERADALLNTKVQAWDHVGKKYVTESWRTTNQGPSKEAAAVRRSSLDLSRALSHMRRRR